jgi:hypothetical protein
MGWTAAVLLPEGVCFSSPPCPNRLGGQPSFLLREYRGPFKRKRNVTYTSKLVFMACCLGIEKNFVPITPDTKSLEQLQTINTGMTRFTPKFGSWDFQCKIKWRKLTQKQNGNICKYIRFLFRFSITNTKYFKYNSFCEVYALKIGQCFSNVGTITV